MLTSTLACSVGGITGGFVVVVGSDVVSDFTDVVSTTVPPEMRVFCCVVDVSAALLPPSVLAFAASVVVSTPGVFAISDYNQNK